MTIRAALVLSIGLIVVASVGAAEVGDVAAAVGGRNTASWQERFTAELTVLSETAHISPAGFDVALRAIKGQTVAGSADDAARLVFRVCVRADNELRKGIPPAEVALQARLSLHEWDRTGKPTRSRQNAQDRMDRQLSGMGQEISGDMERRPGPQSGPEGNGGTPKAGSASGAAPGGNRPAVSDGGSGSANQ